MKEKAFIATPGSARVARAGDGVSPSRTSPGAWKALLSMPIRKFVAVEHRDQHARRVRYPILSSRSVTL